MVSAPEPRWIVRLRPIEGRTVDALLRLPFALDVWEREGGALVVSTDNSTLQQIEQRKLAHVQRICLTADYVRWGRVRDPEDQ